MHNISVVCVKWGEKYSSEFVNRLYTMIKRNLTTPFTFYCLTENSKGIDVPCQILEFDDPDLEIWWNKLNVFRRGLFLGRVLYFDLDTVIQNNIDELVTYSDKLCGVRTRWHELSTGPDFHTPIHRYKTPFNSSVLSWNAEDYYFIWDKFQQDKDWHIIKYYGDDKFIPNECGPVDMFPEGWVYSRMYGMYEHSDIGKEIVKYSSDISTELYYCPEAKICMFNGPTWDFHYKGFEKYWKDM